MGTEYTHRHAASFFLTTSAGQLHVHGYCLVAPTNPAGGYKHSRAVAFLHSSTFAYAWLSLTNIPAGGDTSIVVALSGQTAVTLYCIPICVAQ